MVHSHLHILQEDIINISFIYCNRTVHILHTKHCEVSEILRDIYDLNGKGKTLEAATQIQDTHERFHTNTLDAAYCDHFRTQLN
jgi:hypothetical protein